MNDQTGYIKADNVEIQLPECRCGQQTQKQGGFWENFDFATLVIASAVSVLVGIVIRKVID